MQAAAEAQRLAAKELDRASLLLRCAARQTFAGAHKAASESVREALEILRRVGIPGYAPD